MGTHNKLQRWFGAAAVLAVGLAGCGGDDNATPGSAAPGAYAAETVTVKALDNTFDAETLTIAPGTKVVWENRGRNDHDILVAEPGGAETFGVTKADFAPKATYAHTFTKPGTYAYFCSLHGTKDKGMIGKVVVTGGDETAAQPSVSTVAPSSSNATTAPADGPATLAVPGDFATIQAAVDAATPGDLVLISPGTYNEAVNVTTDNLTLRGLDRNTVILDGQLKLDNGIRVLGAKGVAVENMTATNYTANGFFWTGVDGYRGSYLNAYRTGDYGVYAFDSINGQLDHVYAAGSPDAGVYIGQCYPCNAVIDRVVSEHNGLGYSGTNSGGNLLIVNSTFRNNRAGIVPNSGSYEMCYPERETTIVGNVVYSNNQPDTAAIDVAMLAMGNGILSAGGISNIIERNLVYDHDKSGIGLVPFLEEDPNDEIPGDDELKMTCAEQKKIPVTQPDGALLWDSKHNRVVGNVLENNRAADVLLASVGSDLAMLGNCVQDNSLTTTAPNALQDLAPCSGAGSGDWNAGAYNIAAWLTEQKPPAQDWKTAPLPALTAQENMPSAATAPPNPAVNVPAKVDLATIQVPAKP